MAGRGGKQQSVQIEIRNQEEWDSLIPRQGLTVVDVYASWCGPCKAIVSLFRNIKNKQSDDFLSFATADAATIDSLEDYRGKSEPTFLFYGSGHLVCVLRGVNGPHITKVVDDLVKKEREIVEGKVVRERFVDKAVSPEEEEKEEDEGKEEEEEEEEVDQEENELAKEMTIRKSAGSVLKLETIAKHITVAVIRPAAVQWGVVDQIAEAIASRGFDIVKRLEHSLTPDEAKQLSSGVEDEESLNSLTSSPCILLAVSRSGDSVGENVVAEFCALVGTSNEGVEETSSLRSRFGAASISCSTSSESAAVDLKTFFAELSGPTVEQEVPQNNLQRTIAIIRPHVEKMKDILHIIDESGFVIAMQKEVTLTKDQAGELYGHLQTEEYFENLITMSTDGLSLVLCLAKSNAVETWKEMLQPKTTTNDEGEETTTDLQKQFGGENCVPPLHGSDNIAQFERDFSILFPMQTVALLLHPSVVADDSALDILSRLKHEGFHVENSKETTLTPEQIPLLYKDPESEHLEETTVHMTSGPSLVLLLTREDATHALHKLLGPADPKTAKESDPTSLRAVFGKDVVHNAATGFTGQDELAVILENFFSAGPGCDPVASGAEEAETSGESVVEAAPAAETTGEILNTNEIDATGTGEEIADPVTQTSENPSDDTENKTTIEPSVESPESLEDGEGTGVGEPVETVEGDVTEEVVKTAEDEGTATESAVES